MEVTPQQVRAFRYWIQGYQNFYEPIVGEYFSACGYRVVSHPAIVNQGDLRYIISRLFDGHKVLGPEIDAKAAQSYLGNRTRLQPDFLLEKNGCWYLAELKSWGGFTRSGQFDLTLARSEFIRKLSNSAYLLIDLLNGHPITGKLLVVSSRSSQHDQVVDALRNAFRTHVDLLYLDEIFRSPAVVHSIEQQLQYLQHAVNEIHRDFLGKPTSEAA